MKLSELHNQIAALVEISLFIPDNPRVTHRRRNKDVGIPFENEPIVPAVGSSSEAYQFTP